MLIDEGRDSRAGALGLHIKAAGVMPWSLLFVQLHRWDLNSETGY
jgi:hypothetical protein